MKVDWEVDPEQARRAVRGPDLFAPRDYLVLILIIGAALLGGLISGT